MLVPPEFGGDSITLSHSWYELVWEQLLRVMSCFIGFATHKYRHLL